MIANPTIVALALLLVVLVVAARAARWVAVVISVLAMLAFNFFFLPPVGTFTIADPQNWVVLFTFLAVSLAASHLSAVARSRTDEAVVLVPPIQLSLESAIEFIDDDELVEITPKTIRIRKRFLLEHERKRASREAA